MQNRKAADAMKSTIDAAALQADNTRRLKMPGGFRQMKLITGAPIKRSSSTAANSTASSYSSSAPSSTQIYCVSCRSANPQSAEICNSCGYFLTSAQQYKAPSLAEMRGLVVPAPRVEVMIDSEWDVVEGKLAGRNDAFCPICMDGFKEGRDVLLSCSHIFHRHCLASFEKFMKNDELSCPVCRGTKYQKKITRQGAKAYEVVCAKRIQTFFRGYLARKRYYVNIRKHYQKGPGGTSNQRTKFYEKELSVYMNRMEDDFSERKRESDSIFSSVDDTMNESKQLDILFENMLRQRGFLNPSVDS